MSGNGKVSRRQALWAVTGAIGGLVVGFAGGWLARQPERAAVETITVTRTETVERTVEVAKKVVLGMVLGGYIEGSTWDGRQKIAVDRLKKLYPWFDYVLDEGVVLKGRDPVSSAKDLITINNANIIFGSWEPAAVPAFHRLSRDYPDVYFLGIIGSDVSSQRNFMRVFVRQYQAMYLEGLVAGAITQSNKIGIAVGPAVVQNLRRMAAFYLGIKEVNPNATLYVKYVGEWYDPPKEREVAQSLVDQGVDVLTHYTDSVEPLKVAEEREIWFVGKDMDVVGLYKWSTTDTVAVSFDTRWEVMFDIILRDYMAGITHPDRIVFVGMNRHIPLPSDNPWVPGQTSLHAVDLQNDNKVGIEAISPKVRNQIPEEILKLIEKRRAEMIAGAWDPFYEYPLVSSGEGIPLPELNIKVPEKGTVVKPAKTMPSDEWLLGRFNFQLDGIVTLK